MRRDDVETLSASLGRVRKERDEWRHMARSYKEEMKDKDKEMNDLKEVWAEKEQKYKRTIRNIAKDMKARKKFHGRSKLRAANMDTYDNANKTIIGNYC